MKHEIKVLTPELADKIAAGEVVERPASVVKELVENSIDAGADTIRIEIENGGITLIRISDNGSGIPREQVPTAFLRHATSKLRSEDGLYAIETMGFRGEALSSICAVASVEVITRTPEDEIGVQYTVDHGVCGEPDEIMCACGSVMTVRDLFKNVPARMKFLKRNSTEAGYVSDLALRLALSRPDISFEYVCDGKRVFRTTGDGDILNVILKVYGLKYAKGARQVSYTEDGINITGTVGGGELAAGNRSRQTVFVNGRYIKNHIISKVVEEAFRNVVMTGKFPFFVLSISMPPEAVDVNVHPAKTEVKFANEKQVYDTVYHAVKNAIYQKRTEEESGDSPSAPAPQSDSVNAPRKEAVTRLSDSGRVSRSVVREYLKATTPDVRPREPYIDEEELKPSVNDGLSKIMNDFFSISTQDEKAEEAPAAPQEKIEEPTKAPQEKTEEQTAVPLDTGAGIFDDKTDILSSCKIIGQLFNTYILIEDDTHLYMIDQHAAHERRGFEDLKRDYFSHRRMSQLLLSPVAVELTAPEFDAVMSGLSVFEGFGFKVEEFGTNAVIINETPVITDSAGIKELFCEILSAMMDNIKHPVADFEEKALDMISCKKAVKGNDRLSLSEMTEVVKMVSALKAEGIETCPHGRPIMVELSRRDIEKMFKRIV